ncbi:MAG: non-homologous end-joining DNA ligase [Tepidisphaeraceae bacterium]
MPRHVAPMLAVPSDRLPRDAANWGFEYKWDGVRAIAYCDRASIHLESRNLLDITVRYPELQPLANDLGRRVVLDGEIVALDDTGRPSFAMLQRRMHANDRDAIARLRDAVPVYYFVFDVLWLEGQSLMSHPYAHRREILDDIFVPGDSYKLSPVHADGDGVYETAQAHRLEGIIAKRLDSPYQPGRRTPAWRKIKLIKNQEFVIGGWTPEKDGSRRGYGLGALLVGYYEPAGGPGERKLRLAGKVGSGFTAVSAETMLDLLQSRRRATNPFADRPPQRDAMFIEPVLVAEIEYRRWPEGGQVQQAVFKGLRTDKRPTEVLKESDALTRE